MCFVYNQTRPKRALSLILVGVAIPSTFPWSIAISCRWLHVHESFCVSSIFFLEDSAVNFFLHVPRHQPFMARVPFVSVQN